MDEMIEKVKNGYTIYIYKNKLELSKAVFKFIESQIVLTLKNKERFKFCVSGGSTPKSVYQLLSNSNLKWDFVDVFLGDERCVDPNSELSNSLMLKNSLLTNFGSEASDPKLVNKEFFNINELLNSEFGSTHLSSPKKTSTKSHLRLLLESS